MITSIGAMLLALTIGSGTQAEETDTCGIPQIWFKQGSSLLFSGGRYRQKSFIIGEPNLHVYRSVCGESDSLIEMHVCTVEQKVDPSDSGETLVKFDEFEKLDKNDVAIFFRPRDRCTLVAAFQMTWDGGWWAPDTLREEYTALTVSLPGDPDPPILFADVWTDSTPALPMDGHWCGWVRNIRIDHPRLTAFLTRCDEVLQDRSGIDLKNFTTVTLISYAIWDYRDFESGNDALLLFAWDDSDTARAFGQVVWRQGKPVVTSVPAQFMELTRSRPVH